jgi:hypothetical protein
LGNLTLITSKLNPALSNSAWSTKRPELLKYSKLNRYFHDSASWDEQAIRDRGKALAAKAREIWPYPPYKNILPV